MKKIGLLLLCLLLLGVMGTAAAVESPLVQEREAAEIAENFLRELLKDAAPKTDVDIWDAGSGYTAYEPYAIETIWKDHQLESGWSVQFWNAFSLSGTMEIHGKTGEVVFWHLTGDDLMTDSFTSLNYFEEIENLTKQHFYSALPESKEELGAKALFSRACADFAYHAERNLREIEAHSSVIAGYGRGDHLGWLDKDKSGPYTALEFEIYYTQPGENWKYRVVYRLPDGEKLVERLSCNREEVPLKQ